MEVTRDVIRDLIPAVVAGEASADSRGLVEGWLAGDPALAREAEALRAALHTLSAVPRAAPRPDAEREAVARVRRRLRGRSLLLAAAIFLTLLPFTFGFTPRGLEYFMLRDNTSMAVASMAAALGCWVGLALLGRRGRPAA